MEEKTVQLNKYLSLRGIASRRKVEDLVREGRVKINGQIITNLGRRVDPDKEKIEVDGNLVGGAEKKVYLMLNKPKGVVSSVSDEQGRRTVVDLVRVRERVYPVGRLDENSTGLVLLTNDGEVANILTHPRFEVPKTYQVLVEGSPTEFQLKELQAGVSLKDGRTAPAKVEILEKEPRRTRLRIIIHEGRNHQVKRMMEKVHLSVLALKRVTLGPLKLGDLKVGQSRFLTPIEIKDLKGGENGKP